jgi:hypothetical protein
MIFKSFRYPICSEVFNLLYCCKAWYHSSPLLHIRLFPYPMPLDHFFPA